MSIVKNDLPTMTMIDIQNDIKKGKVMVLYDGYVLDLTEWVLIHPGGKNTIKFRNGKAIDDQLHAFHPEFVWKAKAYQFAVARFDKGEKLTVAEEKDKEISLAYQELNKQLRAQGFYKNEFSFFTAQVLVFCLLGAGGFGLIHYFPNNLAAIIGSAVLFGLLWHGVGFVLHDIGHHSIVGIRIYDDYIGYFLGTVLNGISMSWWQHHHNTHHAAVNYVEHDPDIQNLPFMAFSERFRENLYSYYLEKVMVYDSTAKFFVAIQSVGFYLFIPLERLILQMAGVSTVFDFSKNVKYRWGQMFGIFFYYLWFGYGIIWLHIETWPMRLLYIVITVFSSALFFFQITLSHYAMPTEEPECDELFVTHQCRTTMNADSSVWLDWFFGGFHLQIEHHLFPRMPRSRLRAVQPIVKQFCAKYDLPYTSPPWWKVNGLIHEVLASVPKNLLHSSWCDIF